MCTKLEWKPKTVVKLVASKSKEGRQNDCVIQVKKLLNPPMYVYVLEAALCPQKHQL